MPVSKERIEQLYGSLPMLRPPETIYELSNASIGADRLFNATHQLNRASRHAGDGWHIFGMTRLGTRFITLAGDAPETTVVHEAVHGMGLASEPATYALTRVLMARSRANLGLVRKQVHYTEAPVSPAEQEAFLKTMRLSLAPGEAGEVRLVKLVYTP